VLTLLEFCEEERVVLKDEYTKDIYVEKYDIELEFNERLKSEKQRAEAEAGNLYFQGVSFNEDCKIPLPFGLKVGDDRRTCISKINKNSKILHISRAKIIDSILLEDEDKKYFFKLKYLDDKEQTLVSIFALTFDVETDLNQDHIRKRKISIEEALL
jgi:hypothetical protein